MGSRYTRQAPEWLYLLRWRAALKVTSPLHKAGFLHRDISINNLMINEDDENPSRRAFLIDLDLAIRTQREGASGAKGKTGTRAFMAIGALLGNEQHSFMHDLESFFWVLFWICIHCNEPDEGRVVPRFEKWNYVGTEELAELKKGQVSHEGDFIRTAEENFTSYYRPLTLWVNRLRKAVFPAETVEHFLFRCKKRTMQREAMFKGSRTRIGNLSFFLGGKAASDDEEWKPNMQAMRAAIKFAIAANRLDADQRHRQTNL